MSQIFKEKINKSKLYDLLDQICFKNETKYIFDNSSYKKANMQNLLEPFIESIKPAALLYVIICCLEGLDFDPKSFIL